MHYDMNATIAVLIYLMSAATVYTTGCKAEAEEKSDKNKKSFRRTNSLISAIPVLNTIIMIAVIIAFSKGYFSDN